MSGETDTTVTLGLEMGKAGQARNFGEHEASGSCQSGVVQFVAEPLFDLSKPDERFSAVALGDERETVAWGEGHDLFE